MEAATRNTPEYASAKNQRCVKITATNTEHIKGSQVRSCSD
jgi:hypothetical protein